MYKAIIETNNSTLTIVPKLISPIVYEISSLKIVASALIFPEFVLFMHFSNSKHISCKAGTLTKGSHLLIS